MAVDTVLAKHYTVHQVDENSEPQPTHMLCPGCCKEIDLMRQGQQMECDSCSLIVTHVGDKMILRRETV